jgi:hypothetical protein
MTDFILEAQNISSSNEMESLRENILILLSKNKNIKKVHVAATLLMGACLEYSALDQAYKDSLVVLSSLAIHTRNLLEISVMSVFSLSKADNAGIIYDDAGRDAKEIVSLLIDWGQKNQMTSEWLQKIVDADNRLDETAKDSGVNDLSGKYTKVSDMAQAVGLGDHFKYINKFLSKLSHPTSYQLLMINGSTTPEFEKHLYIEGCKNFIISFKSLQESIKIITEEVNA